MAEEIVKTPAEETAASTEEKPVEEKEIVVEVKPKTVAEGKTYTAEEVNNLLAENTRNSAKTVKDQLYPEINRNKNQVKDLKTKIKDLETAKPKNAEEQKVVDDKKADLDNQLATANQELAVTKEKLKVIEDTAVDAVNKVNEFSQKFDESVLSEHRLKAINAVRASGSNLIETMVVGNTKEEINASVEEAKAEYEKVVNGVRKDLKLPSVTEEKESIAARAKAEEVEEKATVVSRIKTDGDFKNWGSTRNDILKSAYRKAGVNV